MSFNGSGAHNRVHDWTADLALAIPTLQSGWMPMARGEPNSDAVDRLHTIADFARVVDRPPGHISDAIASGNLESVLQHADKDFRTHTVSMRMWLEYEARR
jgi:hypothetical protein